MAPADDSDSFRIDFVVHLQHKISRRMNVFDFQSSIINRAPELDSITAAPAIIRRDHGIPMLNQISNNNGEIVGRNIAVNFGMSQDDERQFVRAPLSAWHKG